MPKKWINFAIIFVIILLIPYFIIFRYGFSHCHTSWGEFGSYLSGITTLVFAIINIFIWYALADKQKKDSNQMLEKQNTNDKENQEISNVNQKKLMKLELKYDTLTSIRNLSILRQLYINQDDFFKQYKTFEDILYEIELGLYDPIFIKPSNVIISDTKNNLNQLYNVYTGAVVMQTNIVDTTNKNVTIAHNKLKSNIETLLKHYIEQIDFSLNNE